MHQALAQALPLFPPSSKAGLLVCFLVLSNFLVSRVWVFWQRVCLCITLMQALQRPEEGFGSPDTGVTGHLTGAGN